MLRLFKFLKPYWWQVLLLIMFTGGEVFATLQLPALMADIINKGIVVENTGYIWQTGLIMVGIAVLSAGCALASSYFSARVGANFSRDIREAIYKKVLSLNLADTKDYSTASLINRTTNDVNQVQQVTMMMLSVMLLAPMFCILALIMAIRTAPDMTWIIAVGVVAILSSIIIIMALVMGAVVYAIGFTPFPTIVRLIAQIIAGAVVYYLLLRFTKNETLYYAKDLIKKYKCKKK